MGIRRLFFIALVTMFSAVAPVYPVWAAPRVTLVSKAEHFSKQLPATVIKELTDVGAVFNAPSDPVFKTLVPDILKVLEGIILSTDKAQNIELVIIDSMKPNAFFYGFENDRAVVGISLGALLFVKNNDELAAIFGHELEHGESKLTIASEGNYLLRRTVEIEVDVKSMFRRVWDKGYNPHAWLHLVERFRGRKGKTFGHFHADWEARGDALSIAFTDTKRTQGRVPPADEPSQYTPGVIEQIHKKFFETPAFKARQDMLWQKDLDSVKDWAKASIEDMSVKVDPLAFEAKLELSARSRYGDLLLDEEVAYQYKQQSLEVLAAAWVANYEAYKLIHRRFILTSEREFRNVFAFFNNGIPPSITGLDVDGLARVLFQLKLNRSDNREAMQERLKFAQSIFKDWPAVKSRAERFMELAIQLRNIDESEVEQIALIKQEMAILQASHRQNLPPVMARLLDLQASGIDEVRAAVPAFIDSWLNDPDKWQQGNGIAQFLIFARDSGVKEEDHGRVLQKMFNAAQLRANRQSMHGSVRRDSLARLLYSKEFNTVLYWVTNQSSEMPPAELRVILQNILIAASYNQESFESVKNNLSSMAAPLLLEVRSRLAGSAIPKLDIELEKIFSKIVPGPRALDFGDFGGINSQIKTDFYNLQKLLLEHNAPNGDVYERLVGLYSILLGHTLKSYHDVELTSQDLINLTWLMVPLDSMPATVNGRYLHSSLKAMVAMDQIKNYTRPSNAIPRFDFHKWFERVALTLPNEQRLPAMREVFAVLQPEWRANFVQSHDVKFLREFIQWMTTRHDLSLSEKRLMFELLQNERAVTGNDERVLYNNFKLHIEAPTNRRLPGESIDAHLRRAIDDTKDIDIGSHFDFERISNSLTFAEKWHLFRSMILGKPQLLNGNSVYISSGGISATDSTTQFSVMFNNPTVLQQGLFDPELQKQIPLRELSEVFCKVYGKGNVNELPDTYFDQWWKLTKNNPELRRLFKPEYIQKFKYDVDRLRIAEWQLEDRFGIEAESKRIRRLGMASSTDTNVVRQLIIDIRNHLVTQFPTLGSIRDLLIRNIEAKLVTNEAETSYLHALQTNADNWTQATTALSESDATQLAAKFLSKSAQDRLDILEYLVGLRAENPVAAIRARQGMAHDENLIKEGVAQLDETKTNFLDSSIEARAYTLMTFVDHKHGVLSSEECTNQLLNGLLGARANNPVIIAMIKAYLKSSRPEEAKVLLARIAAEKSRVGSRKGISLADILPMMGALGIKGGQFLKSSGVAGPELQKELQDLLNKANPPGRTEIFSRLRLLLGSHYPEFSYIGEIVGSGSINYVIRALHRDPRTGIERPVVIRVLREAVQGQAANEQTLWIATTQILRESQDPKQIEAADIIDEARETAMRTLGENGQELDLSNEERWYGELSRAYQKRQLLPGDFKIELARPLTEILPGLTPEEKRSVAIYQQVEGIALWEVADPELRARLARQILWAELNAIFTTGAFDPDSHLGNWIIDLKNNRLVRIDYSQAIRLNVEERRTIRDFSSRLLKPQWNSSDALVIAELFSSVFQSEAMPSQENLRRWIEELRHDPQLPSYDKPQERLFHLRMKIEERSGVKIRSTETLQAVFGSFGRLTGLSEHANAAAFYGTWMAQLQLNPLHYVSECMKMLLE